MAKPPSPSGSRVAPQGQAARAPRTVGTYFAERAAEQRAQRFLAAARAPEELRARASVENPEVGAVDPEAGSGIIDSLSSDGAPSIPS